MIEIESFKKEYPKSYALLVELYNDPKLGGLLSTKDREQALEMALIYSPRFLFDWFDKQEIYISIYCPEIPNWDWDIEVKGEKTIFNKKTGSSRAEVEMAAFLEAFKIIETR